MAVARGRRSAARCEALRLRLDDLARSAVHQDGKLRWMARAILLALPPASAA